MEQISSELNYSPVVSNHSSVIYRNVSPQGSTSLALSSGSLSGPVEFVLSSSAFRLGLSRLNFQLSVAAGTTGHNYLNGNTTSYIGRMVIYDAATSNILMDVNNFEKYGQLITPMCTPATELASKAQATIIAPAASIGSIGPQDTSPESTFNPVEDLSKSNLLIAQLFRSIDFTINGDLSMPKAIRFAKTFLIWWDLCLAILIKTDPIKLLNKRYS